MFQKATTLFYDEQEGAKALDSILNNFKENPQKLNYIYILTPKGVAMKTKLTINFMKRKMKEYDELKKEIEN